MQLRRLMIAIIGISVLFAVSCRSNQQIVEKASVLTVHDTVRLSVTNDRHDSIVYIYRNDTVMVDRWHKLTKVDTVYKTQFVHNRDTVCVVEEKVNGRPNENKWTLKDNLKAFLIGIFMLALISIGARNLL